MIVCYNNSKDLHFYMFTPNTNINFQHKLSVTLQSFQHLMRFKYMLPHIPLNIPQNVEFFIMEDIYIYMLLLSAPYTGTNCETCTSTAHEEAEIASIYTTGRADGADSSDPPEELIYDSQDTLQNIVWE